MKNICLYFQLHQPVKLRRYRFFEIGKDHYYYDDYLNESTISRLAHNSYLPANELLLALIKKHPGKFFVSFSISGTTLDQLKIYSPQVIDSFKQLAATGQVEFLAETDAHSLASLRDVQEFKKQTEKHVKEIEELFGQTPTVFRNSELIYSDMLGDDVAQMGFKAMLAEGAKQVLGWKSPNFMYCNAAEPRLKVLLKNFVLSDDLAFKFGNQSWSEWPLTADKYIGWLESLSDNEELVNLFLNYETFGENQKKDTGIFKFLEAFVNMVVANDNFEFITPSKAVATLQPISAVHVPQPTSWADEERDLSAWMGNELQTEALDKLYELTPLASQCNDADLLKDWKYLQASDHFYFMSTKFFSSGVSKVYHNPYDTPYDAFINYMNVLSDFAIRLKKAVRHSSTDDLVNKLKSELAAKDLIIEELTSKKYTAAKTKPAKKPVKKETAKKETSKKEAATKEAATKETAKTKTTKKVSEKKTASKTKTADKKG